MTQGARRAVGSGLVVLWLAIYIVLAATIGSRLDGRSPLTALFYAVAGIAWIAPLKPLFTWMREGKRLPDSARQP